MKKNYYSPGGNPTLLIDNTDRSIQPDEYARIARENLDAVEQVGFIEQRPDASYRLGMMGGEVCVNGIRSLAYWDYQTHGTTKGLYACSGTTATFECAIETWVSIKIPKRFVRAELFPFVFVKLDGIAYFVMEGRFDLQTAREELFTLQIRYCDTIKEIPAIGLIMIEDGNRVWPLISVTAVGSITLESGCGTGTLAAYIACQKKQKAFLQPSGKWYIVDDEGDFFTIKSIVEETASN